MAAGDSATTVDRPDDRSTGGPAALAVCRACGRGGLQVVVDLGEQPPAERFITAAELGVPDHRLPLRILVCPSCWLVQLEGSPVHADDEPAGLAFTMSATMRSHVAGLVDDALARLRQPPRRVVELASHGNRLHEIFAERGVTTMLIEPTAPHAAAARAAGVEVTEAHLGPEVARRIVGAGGPADLVVDAFHLAHESDPAAWAAGLAELLAPDGVAVVEFDHLLPVVADNQYDGFRHGHASYLSLTSFRGLLARAGLRAIDAVRTPAYGGSLRVIVRHEAGDAGHELTVSPSVDEVLAAEDSRGLTSLAAYREFARRIAEARRGLRAFFDDRRADGAVVVGYGAPSRGNTLLNSSGISAAELPFVVDRAPGKHGQYLPGSRIPIRPPAALLDARPDYVIVLTWDILDEVVDQLAAVRTWGGRFVVPLPAVRVVA